MQMIQLQIGANELWPYIPDTLKIGRLENQII